MSKQAEAVHDHAAKSAPKATIADLKVDAQRLHDEVCQLQQSPGNVTQEDEMLIDAIQGKVEALLAKIDELH